MRILMVCLGNICRSPMAEGVLRKKLIDNRIDWVQVDSCGFVGSGEPPHPMAVQTAKKHGIFIENQRQRRFFARDFELFDKIYVMDSGNYQDVKDVARNEDDMQKVDYLLNEVFPGSNKRVPDPYGGTECDYKHAFSLIEQACEAIVEKLKSL